MRIGVDATSWSNRRGYGRYTRALLTALLELDQHNHYTFFVDYESDEFPLPQGLRFAALPPRSRPYKRQARTADGRCAICGQSPGNPPGARGRDFLPDRLHLCSVITRDSAGGDDS